jgi:hypothetical protein
MRFEVRPPGPTDGYPEWCHVRQCVQLPWSMHGAYVLASDGKKEWHLSSCFFYPAGPWFRVDGFVTNPAAPPRLRLKALELTLEQVLSYSAATGMKPIVSTSLRSIARKLRLMGFQDVPGVTLIRQSRSMVGEMPEPEPAPKKKAPKKRGKVQQWSST